MLLEKYWQWKTHPLYLADLHFLHNEGVKFSVSMGKIFFDKNQICIIVLSKFLALVVELFILRLCIAYLTPGYT